MQQWWDGYPWRMIQTNLREIDMENMDAVKYAKDLKEFGATVVLLNAAGIIASYESELEFHPVSSYLNGDSLRQMIEECHKQGIRVIARTDFSKIRSEVYEQNPDWAYCTKDGEIVNYNGDVHTCPNGEYQQTYMFKILEEMLTTHPFDGVFCNMSGFHVIDYSYQYYGPCHCENCKRKFNEQFGLELPQRDDPRDPVYNKYTLFKKETERSHTERMRALIKGINPDIAINGLDYIRSESNTEIGRPQWQYSSSSNARVISGPENKRPTDNASVDFIGFRYRYSSVSPALMELRQWQNLANSGCLSMYIIGTLDNHRDVSAFEPTKKVFQFHKENEEFYKGLTSKAKVLVMRNSVWQRDPEACGWVRALTESHIPFDEMFLRELSEGSQINSKEVIVLSDMKLLSDKQVEIIDQFAAKGGTVIATGETGLYTDQFEPRPNTPLQCLGVDQILERKRELTSALFEANDKDLEALRRLTNAPLLPLGTQFVMTKPKPEATTFLSFVPDHPFGPPERCYYDEVTESPGVIRYSFDKGQGIYIPWQIGSFYYQEGYDNTLNLMKDILFSLCELDNIAPELTPMVEINHYEKGTQQVIQLVNNTGCFANSYFEPLPVHNISIELAEKKESATIKCLKEGNVKSSYQNGKLVIQLDKLEDYEAIIIS